MACAANVHAPSRPHRLIATVSVRHPESSLIAACLLASTIPITACFFVNVIPTAERFLESAIASADRLLK